ncbi:MAG: nucleotidyltransferase domain-containing protein, partial [Candidatus Hydrothermarchaeales archaeon]
MEDVIGKKTAVRILSVILRNSLKEFKETELIRNSKVGKGAGADAIDKLSLLNIVKIKRVGRIKMVSFNMTNPLAFALRQLFDQERFLSLAQSKVSVISLFKQKAHDKAKAIVLFGSLASGAYTAKSDIDLLVITDDEKELKKIKDEVLGFAEEKINLHFLQPSDVLKEINENTLIKNAIMTGIILSGGNFIREILKKPEDLKDLEFLKERINAAWRNYSNRDYESAKEIISNIREHLAFMICKVEGVEALSRKDA